MESAIFIGTPALFNVAMGALCIAGAVVAEIIPLLGVVPAAAGRPTGPVNSVAPRSAGAVLDRTPGAPMVSPITPQRPTVPRRFPRQSQAMRRRLPPRRQPLTRLLRH